VYFPYSYVPQRLVILVRTAKIAARTTISVDLTNEFIVFSLTEKYNSEIPNTIRSRKR